MKVAFYLPVVTPWWFENIIVHLIRVCAREAEVHVLVPPLWRNTGVGPEQLVHCMDLQHVHWHILDGDDHPSLRTKPANPDELLELMAMIDPDYILCRSADTVTPRLFPGKMRFVMEGAAAPLATAGSWITLREELFDHGCMPNLSEAEGVQLRNAFRDEWTVLHRRFRAVPDAGPGREAYRAATGLPADRTVVAVPLEYENEENFFNIHGNFERNVHLLEHFGEALGDDVCLAVTVHPINAKANDRSCREIVAATDRWPDRMRLVRHERHLGENTVRLASFCDGMMAANSKSFAAAAFFGKPLHRPAGSNSGAWLNAYHDDESFFADLKKSTAAAPVEKDALTWFSFHLANDAFDAADPELRLDDIVGRFERRVDPRRWEAGLDRYYRLQRELFA